MTGLGLALGRRVRLSGRFEHCAFEFCQQFPPPHYFRRERVTASPDKLAEGLRQIGAILVGKVRAHLSQQTDRNGEHRLIARGVYPGTMRGT